MSESATSPWELLDRIYNLFIAYPFSFFAIFIVWLLVIVAFQKIGHVHVSPWWGLLSLIVSVGIVIGILLAFF